MGTIHHKIVSFSLVPLFYLAILLVNYGCLSGKSPTKSTQNRFEQSSQVNSPAIASITFETISPIQTIEGIPKTTSALKCTSSQNTQNTFEAHFSIVEQSSIHLGCKIKGTKDPYVILCQPTLRSGHEKIDASIKVSCSFGTSIVYQTVAVNVIDLNRPPTLETIENQYTFTRNAITAINAGPSAGVDIDADGDALSYSCFFTSTLIPIESSCNDLPGSVEFSSLTGIFNWTPTVADTYSVSIVASDDQDIPLSATKDFVIIVDSVSNPTYTSTTPASPSASSNTPTIKGTLGENVVTIDFFDNSTCINAKIGTGSRDDYTEVGVTLNLASNSVTSIYAIAYDGFAHSSECTLLTQYTHDDIAPTSSSFSFTTPSSPAKTTTTILVSGTSSSDTVSLKFYSDATCVNSTLGTGTRSDFNGSGISITVTANTTTTIYAQAIDATGNHSTCTHLVDFIHDNLAPADPSFASISPGTMTKVTSNPTLLGVASSDTQTIKIYSNNSCTTLLGSGSKNEFTQTGLGISVTPNSTTTLYAKAFDAAENSSNCVNLTTFTHDNTAASAPIFISITPSSPSTNATPSILGSLATDANSIDFFKDSNCTQQIGTGTRDQFISGGIALSITTNVTTSIYAKSYDQALNASACTSLATYQHDNVAPGSISSVLDGTYYYSTTQSPNITWSASNDATSGLSKYQVSIGTSAGATNIKTWTDVGVVLTTQMSGLSLTNGSIYYTNVKAIDLVGLESSVTTSDGWSVDTSAPSAPSAIAQSCSTASFTGSWSASIDAQSGIDSYQYSLGTSAGNTSIVSWTNVSSSTLSINRSDLTLSVGNNYFINVKGINTAGISSSVSSASVECQDLMLNLKAFWHLDETSSSRLDAIGNNDLTDNNLVTSAAGKVDNAASFSAASTQYLSINSTNDLSVNDEPMTISLWIYIPDNTQDAPLLYKWNGSTNEYALDYLSTGHIRFRFGTGSVSKNISITNSTWYHITAYHDASNDLIGVSVNNDTATTSFYNLGTTAGTSDFVLGSNTSLGMYFTGRIDSVGFWKRLLTENEKSTLYNSGNGYENSF